MGLEAPEGKHCRKGALGINGSKHRVLEMWVKEGDQGLECPPGGKAIRWLPEHLVISSEESTLPKNLLHHYCSNVATSPTDCCYVLPHDSTKA